MKVDITDPRMIERQFEMRGLNMMPMQIAALMNASDEVLAKSISDADQAIAVLDGDRLQKAQNFRAAMDVELNMRKAGK